MHPLKMKTYFLIISGLLLLAVLVRVICFVGLIGSDDLNYNRSAYDIIQGTFTPQLDHQRTRLGLFLPVAAAFEIFGVREWSSILFPFCCSLVTTVALVSLGIHFFGKWIGIMAGLLYTFLPIEIFNATMLLADLPAATLVILSGSLLYMDGRTPGHFDLSRSNDTTTATIKTNGGLLLGGFMLGWAYLTRETALFFCVFAMGYMGYKTWARKSIQWGWLWFWLGFLIVVGAEFGYYYWTTGTPFYRYVTIEEGHNVSILALRDRVHGLALLRRLTLDQFRVLFHVPSFNFYYFFIFAGVIYGIQKRITRLYYFIGWFLLFSFLFNFSSTSFLEYYPIRLIPRYFVVLTFPGLIIMAWYFQEMKNFLLIESQKEIVPFRVSLIIPFLLMFVINCVWFSKTVTLFLAGMVILLLLSFSASLRAWLRLQISLKHSQVIIPLILLYVSILPGIYVTAKRERPGQRVTCERDVRSLFEFPLVHTIYTDSRTEVILEYFYQYQYDDQILKFDDADFKTLTNAYVIANRERLVFLNRLYNVPIPDFLSHPPPQWKPYARIEKNGNPCLIYEIP